jgi:hypothetical protein
MSLELADYEIKTRDAVKAFWKAKPQEHAIGKCMDGFTSLIRDLVHSNGLTKAEIHLEQGACTLPGYFFTTVLWNLLIMDSGRLIAAMELSCDVGPRGGENYDNYAAKAVSAAQDFRAAYRKNAFGDIPRPFLGWIMLVEDADGSRSSVRDASSHFAVFPEFREASYIDRYHILCKKLIQEQLYTAAATLASPRTALKDGKFTTNEDMTSLSTFVTTFAGHIAAAAAR